MGNQNIWCNGAAYCEGAGAKWVLPDSL